MFDSPVARIMSLVANPSLNIGSTLATNGSFGAFCESISIPKAVEHIASIVKCL